MTEDAYHALRDDLTSMLGLDYDAVDPEILARVENLCKFRENVKASFIQWWEGEPTGKLGG